MIGDGAGSGHLGNGSGGDPYASARAHFEVADPVLFAAVGHIMPEARSRPREPYAALLRAIVGQQLSTKAAASIWGRVEAHFSGIPAPAKLMAAEDDQLRALGLSRQKAGYLRNVAQAAHGGELESDALDLLSDAELIARLTAIKGVGRWTVEMIMMFGMGRPDVFSTGDLGVQQAIQAIYGFEAKGRVLTQRMVEISAAWSPHRTAACRLLWEWHGAHAAAWKASK